jgi:CIC family chloride channel protein
MKTTLDPAAKQRLAKSLAEMTVRLRHGLGITATGLVLGVVVAYAALASFGAVEVLLSLWQPVSAPDQIGWHGFHPTLILVPTLSGLAIGGLLVWLTPRRPVELADVIHAAHEPDPVVSRTGGYVSLLKSVMAIGAGSTTGLYGPLVVLGASLAASTKRLLNLSPQYAEMALGAGVAAAISAAFSAPLAGIIFAHEVVLRHYNLRFFAPVSLASAAAYVFSGEILNQHITILPIFETRMAGPADIVMLMLLGVLAGLAAVVVMRFVARLRLRLVRAAIPTWLQPALAGLSIGILAHFAPSILGPGLDTISAMMQGEIAPGALLILLLLKIIAAGICLTLFFHGGIVAPALFIGAALGGVMAGWLSLLAPMTGYTPDTALFVLAGMSAMASSMLGAPLAVILLSFELSQNYAATTAIVVTIVIANLLSSRLSTRSVFEPQLLAKGVDLSLGRESLALQQTPVTALMSADYLTLPANVSVRQATTKMAEAHCAEAHLLDGEGQWAGKICLYDLVRQPDDAMCLPLQERTPLILQAHDNALYAQTAMRDFLGEGVPVLKSGVLVGIIHEADLFAHARMVTRSVWQHDHDDAVH